jgi:hypothetical protein
MLPIWTQCLACCIKTSGRSKCPSVHLLPGPFHILATLSVRREFRLTLKRCMLWSLGLHQKTRRNCAAFLGWQAITGSLSNISASYPSHLLTCSKRTSHSVGHKSMTRHSSVSKLLLVRRQCNALNLGVEFFLLFSHQIRALLSFLFPRLLPLPNFKPV